MKWLLWIIYYFIVGPIASAVVVLWWLHLAILWVFFEVVANAVAGAYWVKIKVGGR